MYNMLSTTAPNMSRESLLNLDTLTEEERKIILSVLKKDDELKKTQDKKIGQLKLEIQGIRMKSVLRNGDDLSKICARCHSELGFLFNRGDLCPKCHFRVCRACQEQVLGGTWLCLLCHKQRQLRFLTEEWSNKGKKTKKTGTELIKASMMKKRRPGRVEGETSPGEKSKRVQNGNPVQNGSSHRNKADSEHERIEYPNDSDKRKLSQLFDSFKLSKSSDKSDDSDTKHPVAVKKLSTKRYDDSDSSSSDSEGSVEEVPNSLTSASDAHSPENVSRTITATRGVLQRNYSDDSDQTAMSDETPFLKNSGSTETQIRVDIHSDSSGTTPQQTKRVIHHQKADQTQATKSNHIHDQVIRTESISSYRSTSPEIIDTPTQKRQAYWQNRSPSPYSFDSIPSSHADSPLPKKRFSSEIHQRDSDSDSRVSGISGVSVGGEHSGTESAVKDSGEDEYTVEELSKIRFRRVSRKHPRQDGSPENRRHSKRKGVYEGQSTVSEVHQGGSTGKGRVVTLDLPEEMGCVQVSQISLNDLDLNDDFINLDLVPTPSEQYGEGFNSSELSVSKQNITSKSHSKPEPHIMKDTASKNHLDIQAEGRVESDVRVDKTPIGSIAERRMKLEQAMRQEWHGKEAAAPESEHINKPDNEVIQKGVNNDVSVSKVIYTSKSTIKHSHSTAVDVQKKSLVTSKSSIEPTLAEDALQVNCSSMKTNIPIKQGKDSEFDEIFNLAVADLSVDDSTTDMSDTGSLTRAKGKKIKKLMKKRKTEKKERKLSDSESVDDIVNPVRSYDETGTINSIQSVSTSGKGQNSIEEPLKQKHIKSREKEVEDHHIQNPLISDLKKAEPKEVAEEETINPVHVVREEIMRVPMDKLGKMEETWETNISEGYAESSENNQGSCDESKMASEDDNVGLNITPEMIESGEVDLDKLSLTEIRLLMKHNILPLDEELLRLIDEEMAHNRAEQTSSLDSDELSIIHEESEPNDSDNSNGEIQQTENSKTPTFKFCIPEVRVEEYVDPDIAGTEPKESDIHEDNTSCTGSQGDNHTIADERRNEHKGKTSSESESVCGSIQDEQDPVVKTNSSVDIEIYEDDSIRKLDSPKKDSAEMESPKIDRAKKDSAEMESPKLDRAKIYSPAIDSPKMADDRSNKHLEITTKEDEVVPKCSSIQNEQVPLSTSAKANSGVNIKELQKVYQDIKEQVALETYMETKKIVDPSYDSDPEDDHISKITEGNSLTERESSNKSTRTVADKMGNIQVSLFGAKSHDMDKMSEGILQDGDNEELQTDELHCGTSTDSYLEPDVNKFDLVKTNTRDEETISISSQKQLKDTHEKVVLKTNKGDLNLQSSSNVKKISSKAVFEPDQSELDSPETGKPNKHGSCSSYQHVDSPYLSLHANCSMIGQADMSADITLTPTEQSIDSEKTFCATMMGENTPEGENVDSQRMKSTRKYDIVGQSLSREVLVKQWLSSKTEPKEEDHNIQTGTPDIIPENPALNPVTPACDLDLSDGQTGALPKINMQEWKETETDSGTKLSPRASSEGSASFEDSGHVSGASTQENTPEHRRTDSLQSHTSMGSSRISTLTDKESEEDGDIDELVRSHKSQHSSLGGSRGNLLSTFTDSRESIVSFYSNAGDVDYGKIPITGDIEFALDYNYRTGTLEINIVRCKGLAPADTKRNRSDPYVKTYLLPDKTRSGKRKTKIKKHTLNPVFNETLRYLISKSELENRTVWITVWHNDRFGRNDFLGEVTINFDYYRFGDSAPKWYKLQERFEQPMSMLAYKGDIILCLKYVPPEKVNRDVDSPPSPTRKRLRKPVSSDKGQLLVMIKEARNLTAVRSNGHSDPFCKGQLQPDKEKQKTHVIKKDCNPVWNCTMVFDNVTVASLREKSLELTIWDYDKITSNDFLGGVRLNLGTGRSYGKNVDWMDARGEEISLWQAMLDRPNFWIDGALVLRPSMSKRK